MALETTQITEMNIAEQHAQFFFFTFYFIIIFLILEMSTWTLSQH